MDTVSMNAGYANQIWYSLENGEQGNSAQDNWELAFDASPYGTAIRINSANNVEIWTYPFGDKSSWSSMDTLGIANWDKLYNSDTNWYIGALNQRISASNPFDVGWGIYNISTHTITGDSLFVIKLSNDSFKKLWIKSFENNAFHFRYANLDGSKQIDALLSKADFNNKLFGYYSLSSDSIIDRESISTNWDLIFTSYTTFFPTPYPVTGILSHPNIRVAQVNNVDASTYQNWNVHAFSSEINEIGYDWKSFSMSNGYQVEDSLVYFVKTTNNDIWKIIPIGFGGSANGNFIFSKEKITSVGIEEYAENSNISFSIYPNPAENAGHINISYEFSSSAAHAGIQLMDVSGKMIYSTDIQATAGKHHLILPTGNLEAGMYFLSISTDKKDKEIQKVIIQ